MSYIPNFPAPYTTDTLTVYYIDGCPYCNKTRETLQTFTYNNKPLKYALFNIDHIAEDRQDFWKKIDPYLTNRYFQSRLGSYQPKHKTYPVIFLKGKLIGGNSDLQDILTSLLVQNS